MSSTSGGWINLLIVWGIASAVGFVSMAALMLVGDWSVMQALFAAAVIFLGLGIILSVLFLNPLPGPQVPGSAGKKVVAADRKPAAVKPVANPAPAVAPAPAAAPAAAKPKKAAPTPATAPAPAAAPAGTQGPGKRPAALSAARDNRPDDLKRIKGIGPKL